ncbi:MAG TPA: vanadium-dependent haloperoxidase [Polyangiaceae bacterium]
MTDSNIDRRALLKGVIGSATALASTSVVGCGASADSPGENVGDAVEPIALGPLDPVARADAAFDVRVDAAKQQRAFPIPPHPTNGDEKRYPTKFANYSKALPHDEVGNVDLAAYATLIAALESGRFEDFERVILGGTRPLTDPMSAYAFLLQGGDSHDFFVPPAPRFASAEQQSEAAEDYWMALLRDVPFNEYDESPLARAAIADLNRFSDFRGPKINGKVTPQTLFRWKAPGTLVGPYVSQFLVHDVPYGAQPFAQRNVTRVPGDNRLTDFDEWLAVQNGTRDVVPAVYDPVRRYMRDGRDLAEYVHICQLIQDAYNAAMIIGGFGATPGNPFSPETAGLNPVLLDEGNPYKQSVKQTGFGTFGAPDVYDRLARSIVPALKAVFFQKWLVHRRLRPEEYGGTVQATLTGTESFPIGDELLSSPVLKAVLKKYGTYLLPQAYPEGSPTHPSYPAAHATFIGASATMVKAFFDENFVIPDPMVVSDDGLSLCPYKGKPLTIGGELNKLAMDVAFARNLAGVHWRSDSEQGLYLGEAVAIRIMKDLKLLYAEPFRGFTFTTFSGQKITV